MRKRVCVIGMGRFGIGVASELYQAGHDVLVIDNNEARVQEMLGRATYAVKGDATQENGLRELGVHEYDVAVLTLGDDNVQASILIAMVLKSMGLSYIIARAANQLHGETLERIGVNRVVFPEEESAKRLAHVDFNPDVLDYMEVASNVGISKVRPQHDMVRKTLEAAGLAGNNGHHASLTVLAIRRGRTHILTPSKDEVIQPGDVLVVLGPSEYVASVFTNTPASSDQPEADAILNRR